MIGRNLEHVLQIFYRKIMSIVQLISHEWKDRKGVWNIGYTINWHSTNWMGAMLKSKMSRFSISLIKLKRVLPTGADVGGPRPVFSPFNFLFYFFLNILARLEIFLALDSQTKMYLYESHFARTTILYFVAHN